MRLAINGKITALYMPEKPILFITKPELWGSGPKKGGDASRHSPLFWVFQLSP
jgi:hypothetical protein